MPSGMNTETSRCLQCWIFHFNLLSKFSFITVLSNLLMTEKAAMTKKQSQKPKVEIPEPAIHLDKIRPGMKLAKIMENPEFYLPAKQKPLKK